MTKSTGAQKKYTVTVKDGATLIETKPMTKDEAKEWMVVHSGEEKGHKKLGYELKCTNP